MTARLLAILASLGEVRESLHAAWPEASTVPEPLVGHYWNARRLAAQLDDATELVRAAVKRASTLPVSR